MAHTYPVFGITSDNFKAKTKDIGTAASARGAESIFISKTGRKTASMQLEVLPRGNGFGWFLKTGRD